MGISASFSSTYQTVTDNVCLLITLLLIMNEAFVLQYTKFFTLIITRITGIPTLLVIVNSWKRCNVGLLVLLNETTDEQHRCLLSFLNLAGKPSDRRRNSRLSLMYKSLHGLAGISTFPFRRSSKPTRSADGDTFWVLSSRTDPYKYSFYPRTIVDWNVLLASVKSCPSIHSFCCAIHSSLTNSM